MGKPIPFGALSDDAECLCIVLHGRGQTQQDMMDAIVSRLDQPKVRFVLAKSDREAWYEARAIDPLTEVTIADLQAGLGQIAELIAQEKAAMPGRPVLLCGFSQGACMAAELLFAQGAVSDAACLFTACRVGSLTDDLPMSRLEGFPIYASCGDKDPWIPVDAHHRLVSHLTAAGSRLRTDMFPGRPHEVTDSEIEALNGMLSALSRGQPLWSGRSS